MGKKHRWTESDIEATHQDEAMSLMIEDYKYDEDFFEPQNLPSRSLFDSFFVTVNRITGVIRPCGGGHGWFEFFSQEELEDIFTKTLKVKAGYDGRSLAEPVITKFNKLEPANWSLNFDLEFEPFEMPTYGNFSVEIPHYRCISRRDYAPLPDGYTFRIGISHVPKDTLFTGYMMGGKASDGRWGFTAFAIRSGKVVEYDADYIESISIGGNILTVIPKELDTRGLVSKETGKRMWSLHEPTNLNTAIRVRLDDERFPYP